MTSQSMLKGEAANIPHPGEIGPVKADQIRGRDAVPKTAGTAPIPRCPLSISGFEKVARCAEELACGRPRVGLTPPHYCKGNGRRPAGIPSTSSNDDSAQVRK